MKSYSLTHLADATLLHDLASLVAQDRATTAALLAHLAEVEERKLYLPAACPSMFMYCVRELRMSEGTAFKRIRAARAGRRFPAIFDMLADGRLHVSAVVLLAAHLTPENAEELLAAALHKTQKETELLLAERFPRADVPTSIRPLASNGCVHELSTWTVDQHVLQLAPGSVAQLVTQLAPEPVGGSPDPAQVGQFVPEFATQLSTWPVEQSIQATQLANAPTPAPRAKITPLSHSRSELRLTIDQETRDQLLYAQALLGHAVPSGDVAQVLKRALNALVQQLEQKRFAKCVRLRPRRGSASTDTRYIPAEIRRAVWQRDGGRCTFASSSGRRCEERTRLEFDHLDPIARGGQTLISKIILKCRAHNQYAAECAFGTEFMRTKRQQARCRAEASEVRGTSGSETRSRVASRPEIAASPAESGAEVSSETRARTRTSPVSEQAGHDDVIPWLRQLGFKAEEARRGAAHCAQIPDAPLEQRVRYALQSLAPAGARRTAHDTSGPA